MSLATADIYHVRRCRVGGAICALQTYPYDAIELILTAWDPLPKVAQLIKVFEASHADGHLPNDITFNVRARRGSGEYISAPEKTITTYVKLLEGLGYSKGKPIFMENNNVILRMNKTD